MSEARRAAARKAAAASAAARGETVLQRMAGKLRAEGFAVYDNRPTAATVQQAADAVERLDPQGLELPYMIGWIVGRDPASILSAVEAIERQRADHAINA